MSVKFECHNVFHGNWVESITGYFISMWTYFFPLITQFGVRPRLGCKDMHNGLNSCYWNMGGLNSCHWNMGGGTLSSKPSLQLALLRGLSKTEYRDWTVSDRSSLIRVCTFCLYICILRTYNYIINSQNVSFLEQLQKLLIFNCPNF